MLYIVKRLNDSHYLSSFEGTENRFEFTFTPIESDALKVPQNIAEDHMNTINEILNGEYEVISVK